MIALVAAVAENNVIGNKNKIPWHVRDDLKRFKAITLGKNVLMGRKTFESIMDTLKTSLPKRNNIIVTRQNRFSTPRNCEIYQSLEQALAAHSGEDIYVIGGAEIYRQTMPLAQKLFITEVHRKVAGDAYFPKISKSEWRETERDDHNGYSFVTYENKTPPPR